MRTAVILLGLLAAAAIPGSVLPQRNVASDPAAVLNFATDNPELYPWLDRLGLFEVYASPWFAAIYLLLLVSMTGCVLPRCARLWQAARSAPAPAPRNLTRMEGYRSFPVRERDPVADEEPGSAGPLKRAAEVLRRRGFRVEVAKDEVRAERGYLREVGNLAFHLSLLVLLVGVAAGRLFGFEGRVALAEGETFTNVSSAYDAFTPSVWTDTESLEPFAFTLDEFDAEYAAEGPKSGEPRFFNAALSYQAGANDETRRLDVRPNHPLDVNGTKAFLTGHGYAPVVTVRDGRGDIAFSGPVIFLPNDGSYASDGVVKVPDAMPQQLGFEGFFLPTAATGPQGPYSAFPDALNPQLFLTAFAGDLGVDDGEAQSVYTLDKSGMKQLRQADGQPFARALSVGETMKLPNGLGSLTFDRVGRFANFQIAYDPGKEISLAAGVMLLLGLTTSLSIRRRRIWVRAIPDASGTAGSSTLEVAGQSMTRWPLPDKDIAHLVETLAANATALHPPEGSAS
ncbi:cytochrome c biogenesis protein ResB [Nocardioides sp. T2.26MG-1]|uniref:cytochrome c biogenesis protein ResB n=1 Tax=Nocardioides sp. T2.26MG-1 TaxID=3041166 RepID=UPI002477C288|nr:cytochrome c biogenesis protein ResB [Nocardioides sp. T2.26MG-1]CAI9419291.1 Cytochrome c biogenesis protein Ccs1 [Nocardioides sp. T2.26MG-1]